MTDKNLTEAEIDDLRYLQTVAEMVNYGIGLGLYHMKDNPLGVNETLGVNNIMERQSHIFQEVINSGHFYERFDDTIEHVEKEFNDKYGEKNDSKDV